MSYQAQNGADGDHIDCYIGPQPMSTKVFIVDQIDAETGAFDEHKCFLGYPSKEAAVADYKKAFSDGKGADRIGAITELSVDKFKDWIRDGNTKKPLGTLRKHYAEGGAVRDKAALGRDVEDYLRARQFTMPWYLPESLVGDVAHRYQGVALHGAMGAQGLAQAAADRMERFRSPRAGLGALLYGLSNLGYAGWSHLSGRTKPKPNLGPIEVLEDQPYASGGKVDMPLFKGAKNVGRNISTLEGEGKKRDQAIALSVAGKARPKKAGGGPAVAGDWESYPDDPDSNWSDRVIIAPLLESVPNAMRDRITRQPPDIAARRETFDPMDREPPGPGGFGRPGDARISTGAGEIDAAAPYLGALPPLPVGYSEAMRQHRYTPIDDLNPPTGGTHPQAILGGYGADDPMQAWLKIVKSEDIDKLSPSQERLLAFQDSYGREGRRGPRKPDEDLFDSPAIVPGTHIPSIEATMMHAWRTDPSPEMYEALKTIVAATGGLDADDKPRRGVRPPWERVPKSYRGFAAGGAAGHRDPAIDTALRLARGGFARGGWAGELDSSPADVAPMPERPRSPLPEYLLQQQREGIPGAKVPSGMFEPLMPLAEMTGIPSIARASEAFHHGDTAAGAAALAPLALPPIWRAIPKSAKTLGAAGLFGSLVGADSVGAAKDEKKKALPGTALSLPGLPPELNAEYTTLLKKVTAGAFESRADRRATEERIQQLRALSNDYVTRGSTGRQAEYMRAVENAEGARNKDLARDRRFSDTPMGKLWDSTGGWGPAVVGTALGLASRGATGGGSKVKDYVLPMTAGTIGGAASNNIPLAYNAFYTEPDNPMRRGYEAYARELPPDHPEKQMWSEYAAKLPEANPVRRTAADELYDPVKAAERMFFGGVEGLGGGLLGSDLVRMPGRLVDWGRGKSATTKGSSAPTDRSRIAAEELGIVPAKGGASPPPVAGAKTSLETSPMKEVAPLTASPQRQLPAPEASPNLLAPTSAAPDKTVVIKTKTKDGVWQHRQADGTYTSHPAAKSSSATTEDTAKSSTMRKGNGAGTPRDEIAPGIPKKPEKPFDPEDPINRGHKHGGSVVSGALEIARKYAKGGAVAGPIVGHTDGRADKLPIDVKAGSYVVPADCVAALGSGNSLAGMQKLTTTFGKPSGRSHLATGGMSQNIPIKISDGEFVLDPEQVTRLGGGSIDHGHRIMDNLIKRIRAQHITTLSHLPPPSR